MFGCLQVFPQEVEEGEEEQRPDPRHQRGSFFHSLGVLYAISVLCKYVMS
jgi:hypothetical protein